MITGEEISPRVKKIIQRQPYDITLDEISIRVNKHVPPPDLGKATRSLARILSNYSPSAALDVGCGSGFLAIVMKRNGTDIVWAVDISEETVECAKQNALRNSIFGSVNVVKSDLLTDIPPSVKFDLIVFHQPYFPARPNEYLAGVPDGGQEIISRFLHQMPAHLNTNGVVIMGHQASVGDEHDPKRIARDMGFSVRTVLKERYDDTDHYLYEIRERNPGSYFLPHRGSKADGSRQEHVSSH